MPKQEEFNNPEDNPEETSEQAETSRQLREMAENLESTPESPEQERFKELAIVAAEQGCIAAYSSWPGESIPNQEHTVKDLGTIFDPRIDRRESLISRLADLSPISSEEKYGCDYSPFEILGKKDCQEAINISPVEFYGRKLSLKDVTGRPEDEGKPVSAISYEVRSTEDRQFADHTGRTNSFMATMFLPEKLSTDIYKQIQQEPERIRDLLNAFNQAIVEDPKITADSPQSLKFLDAVHLPTTEASVAILPLENKKQAYFREEDNKMTIKPEYIKKVKYEK